MAKKTFRQEQAHLSFRGAPWRKLSPAVRRKYLIGYWKVSQGCHISLIANQILSAKTITTLAYFNSCGTQIKHSAKSFHGLLLYGLELDPGPNLRLQNERIQVSPKYIALGIGLNALVEAKIWGANLCSYPHSEGNRQIALLVSCAVRKQIITQKVPHT